MDLQEAFDRGFETVKSYVDAELGALSKQITAAAMLPPELAAEVARAVRTLHEAPAVVESEQKATPKVVRIERDTDGNLVPIYDEAQA